MILRLVYPLEGRGGRTADSVLTRRRGLVCMRVAVGVAVEERYFVLITGRSGDVSSSTGEVVYDLG